ncbi:MAG: hypothetical protein ACXVAY_01590 [Mucilaginibacter sp.]
MKATVQFLENLQWFQLCAVTLMGLAIASILFALWLMVTTKPRK